MTSSSPQRRSVTAVLFLLSVGAMTTFAWTADAAVLPCIEDKFGSTVNCTANDIEITQIKDVVVTDDGCSSADDTVTFDATLRVVTTATARYDIGLFIGRDGMQAQNGQCSVFALPTSPEPPYVELDGDQCGDSQSSVELEVPVTSVTVDCVDSNNDNELDIVSCTSWQQNTDGDCSGAADVEPGTASKCNCPTTPTDIPIFVPDPVCVTNADCEELATGCNVGICDVANPDASAFGCIFVPNDDLCDDDQFCNGVETCDAGVCAAGTPPDCSDEFACTADTCDEAADSCVNAPDDSACNDDQFCNGVETCSADVGCVAGTAPDCSDAFACTADSCNEATDSCDNTPDDDVCDDDQFCNGDETCSAEAGCQAGTAPDCDDSVECTDDSCNETTDSCVNAPDDTACDDDLFCNGVEVCDAEVGCTGGIAPACGDAIECTQDLCSEPLDQCVSEPEDVLCDDADPCTEDSCSLEGGCQHLDVCPEGICRSPGFWSTHGDITQDVLDAVGGIEVCGQSVTTIGLDTLDSALEGLCVTPRGVHQRVLYRQLVAAALNCAISNAGDCDALIEGLVGVSIDACSMICAGEDPGEDAPSGGECASALDCYNNGGTYVDGQCATGTCSITGDPCNDEEGCDLVDSEPQDCVPLPGSCHEAEFCQEDIGVCPDTTGRATTSRTCRVARQNDCTIDDCTD